MLTEHGDVPISLYHGNRALPLGRYLREKLREELQMSEVYDPNTGEIFYEGKLRSTVAATQEMLSVFQDTLDDPKASSEEKVSFYHLLKSQRKQENLNTEARQRVFKKGKSL